MSTTNKDLETRIDEVMDMVDENRILLKKIERRLRWSQWIRIIYWVVIIGIGVLGYYAAAPYLRQAEATYEEIESSVGNFTDLFSNNQSEE
jgi:Ni,Fe-hydrogenase I cytochrome b subunit